MNNMTFTFGEAIELMKNGNSVCRAGWNGKGMYIWLNKGSAPTPDTNGREGDMLEPVPFIYGIREELFEVGQQGTNTRLPCINMMVVGGAVLNGWLASQTDMLAEDWMIYTETTEQ